MAELLTDIFMNRRSCSTVGVILRQAVFTILASICVHGTYSNLAAQTTSEYEVKAAFLYKFVGYIEWPVDAFDDDTSPLIIGVVGADQLAQALEQIAAGRTILSRNIQVLRLETGAPLTELHVLFVGQSSTSAAELLLLEAVNRSVLTVTETAATRSSASMINFEVVNQKIRFDVSLKPAEQGGLKISSRLLQVANKDING
jgi:hypothetical protein